MLIRRDCVNLKPFKAKFPIPSGLNKEECYPFDVECLKSSTWEDDPEVLFIIGYVDSGDIHNGRLLTSSPAKDVFETLIKESVKFYRRATGKKATLPNMSVINFNYHRNVHLKGEQKEVSLAAAARRCRKLIDMLKPKKIVCFGKEASGWILNDIGSGIHFGIPKTLDTGKHECIFIPVPSYHNTIMRLDDDASEDDYDEAITHANMIGFISRAMSTMVKGVMPITEEVVPNFEQLKTVSAVDRYLTKLESLDSPFAVDCETNQLTSYGIVLSMIQFATNSDKATIIVVEHHDSPFSKEEQKEVLKRLRKFFLKKNPKTYQVGQNLSYDMRAMRERLRIPVIDWMLWDIMGGEHVLDENLKGLDTKLPGDRTGRNYALDKICLRYGISWYLSAEFSKSQRHLIHEIDLTDDVLSYAAMDVQAPMALHRLQHVMAETIPHEGGNYLDTFHNYVLYVLGNCTTHTISTMEHRGIQLSRPMFNQLMSDSESKLKEHIKQIEAEFYELDKVKEANRELLGGKGAPMVGLFGDVEDWVFKINKEAHIQTLFLDVLEIDDYEEKKNGGAKVGKEFQSKHKDTHKEVELYGEYKKHKAILSTYVVGWNRKIEANADSSSDFRIRPGYSYLLVTGRSNSFNPNLQNVPEHHKSSKYIKETMQAPIGYLKLDADYSSHEVRCWGIASGDPNLANTFKISLECIYELRRDQNKKAFLRFKYESDTHKINYSGFTGVPVKEVTKEQRQAAKGIVFGSMYGIGDGSLAKSINKSLEETREIKGKFFKRYAKGAKWMEKQCESAITNNYVVSLLGRRRNLIGHKIPVPQLQAAFERRAQNSPIQGVASDFGYIAARLYTKAITNFCKEFGIVSNKQYLTEHGWEDQMTDFDTNLSFAPAGIDSMVHDSIKSQVRYDMIFIATYLKEWAMTTGVRKYVKTYLDVDFVVDLGVEIDIGSDGANMDTWQWVEEDLKIKEKKDDGTVDEYTVLGLETLVRNALQAQVKQGYNLDVNDLVDEAKTLFSEAQSFLESKYPLPYHKFRDRGLIN